MRETEQALRRICEAWLPLQERVDGLSEADWSRNTAAGWTAKEMLAHVAFWDEAAVPVVTYMLRGEAIPVREWFGSGYLPDPKAWPRADVHNAREAAWGREHAAAEVLERLRRAHEAVVATVASLPDEEAWRRAAYLQGHRDHYREHATELYPVSGE